MLTRQSPAWVSDLLSLETDPTSPTLLLVPHDRGQISFPALPLLAASSSLAQLVTENMMADSYTPAVIHLPVSWDSLIIVKEIVLTGSAASDGVIYRATCVEVLELMNLFGIEGNMTKTDLNGSREGEMCENLVKHEYNETEAKEEDEINPDASPQKPFEVSSEEENLKLDEGLGDYELFRQGNIHEKEKVFAKFELVRYAGKKSFKRRATAQTCLAPLVPHRRRSTSPTAAAAPEGRFEKKLLGPSEIYESDKSCVKTRKRKSAWKKTDNKKSGTATKGFICEECSKQFKSNSYLTIHKKTVHEGLKYPCDLCPNEATHSGNLAVHKKSIHEGIKYPCDLCPYEATQRGRLITHKKSMHEGVKYPCDLCPYEASHRGNLTIHKQSVHEGLKYPCDFCPYEATQKSYLANHKKRVHEGVKMIF